MIRDVSDILDGLRSVPNLLTEFVGNISAPRMELRRGDGFWTIREHLSHLAQVQPMLLERLERFQKETHPEFVPYIPSDDDQETDSSEPMEKEPALAQFAQVRRLQLDLLERVDASVWQRTATHPEYDAYSFRILARHILMHDHWHMYRMEELWLTKDAYLTKLE